MNEGIDFDIWLCGEGLCVFVVDGSSSSCCVCGGSDGSMDLGESRMLLLGLLQHYITELSTDWVHHFWLFDKNIKLMRIFVKEYLCIFLVDLSVESITVKPNLYTDLDDSHQFEYSWLTQSRKKYFIISSFKPS